MNWEVRTMRSTTSCFDSTLYRKTMARFWPMWVLYGGIWLFAIPLNLVNLYFDSIRYGKGVVWARKVLLEQAVSLPELLVTGVWIACIAGILAAMAVFGYLYNNRSACMMHALPMRRETLFTTQYLAGLSFLVLPQLAVAVGTAAVELILLPSGSWGEVLTSLAAWFLLQSGTCLFFFSFAAFCAMFTGHTLALPAFYGIFNLLVYVIDFLISALMQNTFYGFPGITMNNKLVEYCTPVWALSEACDWETATRNMVNANGAVVGVEATGEYYLQSPGTVAAYAAAGVVFAVLALMVYRCRHVESAGDVVSISIVKPIFLCGVSFCSGLCFGVYTAAFFGWNGALPLSLCVVAWSVVGWFVAEMLLKKSFRVWKTWKGAAVMAVAMVLLCTACFRDWFGVVGRIPDVEDVASVEISANLSYPYDEGQMDVDEITDPDSIAQIIDLHRALVDHRDQENRVGDDYIYVYLTYTLKNGSVLEREYHAVPVLQEEVDQEGTVAWAADRLIRNRELVAQSYNFDRYENWRIVEAYLSNVYYKSGALGNKYLDGAAGEDLEGLWQAVQDDFAEGTIGVRYLFDDNERRTNTYVTDLCFVFERPKSTVTGKDGEKAADTEHFAITMTPNAKHTLAWLEKMANLGTEDFRPHSLFKGEDHAYESGEYAEWSEQQTEVMVP